MGKRIRAQRRGSSPKNRVSSHRFPGASRIPRGVQEVATVVELVHSPVHTAPLVRVKFDDGSETHLVATEGIAVGQEIAIGSNFKLRPGNITELGQIPEGTPISMPSGTLKDLPSKCRASIGVLAGHGRAEKPLMKAGAAHYKAKARGKMYPTVSGVAMNPVDHPHGGGNHQAVHGPNSVSRNAPPGQKVGHIAPSRTGRARGKKE